MQNILSFCKEGFKKLQILIHVHLRSGRHCAFRHAAVELIEWDALPEIIRIRNSVNRVVEANIGNFELFESFLGKVCS